MTALSVPTPKAFGFLFTPTLGALRYRVAYGGRGSAKSWQFARALLVHGLTSPLRILCAREYQASIRDSVHRVLADQIEMLGLVGFYTVQESAGQAVNEQGAGELPRLCGPSAPVGHAVAERPEGGGEEEAERLRGRDVERGHPNRSGSARCASQYAMRRRAISTYSASSSAPR